VGDNWYSCRFFSSLALSFVFKMCTDIICNFCIYFSYSVNKVVLCNNSFFLLSLQTCSEAFREANVAAAFGKPINF